MVEFFLGIPTLYLVLSYLVIGILSAVAGFRIGTKKEVFDTQGDRIFWPVLVGVFWIIALVVLVVFGLIWVVSLLKRLAVFLWKWKAEDIHRSAYR